ncbi:MAG TPA: hypothetical protein VG870_10005 [Chitinophagaceae bacterium]|nr:hypothetical protein [Chitinophagaceae bacterium]
MHYVSHLCKDRRLRKLVEASPVRPLRRRRNLVTYLCGSIMSQQLSTQVARVIHRRFLDLYGGREPTPRQILDTPPETLRGIGLSYAKVSYVKNVAQFELDHGLDARKLRKMTDDEVIAYLTRIKGVGRWTAEMLLMFALGREDVFALDDLGLQQAMIRLYKLDGRDRKKLREDLLRISARWSPYRTYACLHLWQWKDNKPAG